MNRGETPAVDEQRLKKLRTIIDLELGGGAIIFLASVLMAPVSAHSV